MTVPTTGAIKETWKTKENFADNRGHNLLRLFDVWPNFFFTTNGTKLYY